MHAIRIVIPLPPTPWKRTGYNRRTRCFYDTQAEIKNAYRWHIKSKAAGIFWTEPLELSAIFIFGMPESWSQEKKEKALSQEIYVTRRPDTDNLLKFIKDCLTKVLIEDDKQIVKISEVKKIYGAKPSTILYIKTMDQNNLTPIH